MRKWSQLVVGLYALVFSAASFFYQSTAWSQPASPNLNNEKGPTQAPLPSLSTPLTNADIWPPTSHVNPLPPFLRTITASIGWSGTDVGPAGIQTYELQYRVEGTTEWQAWPYLLHGDHSPFPAVPRQKVYFRSRAIDNAGNVEAWPSSPDGDTSTTFYDWDLTGQVSDNRGIPSVNKPLQIEPSPLAEVRTSLDGHYAAHLITSGVHTLNTTTRVDVAGDVIQNLYIHPPDAVGLTTGLVLGEACAGLCIPVLPNDHERKWDLEAGYLFDLVTDQNGNAHIMWIDGSKRTIYYQKRTADGLWQIPELIAVIENSFQGIALAADQQGVVHAVWDDWTTKLNGYIEDVIYYAQRDSTGTWSTPIIIGRGDSPTLYLDNKGGIHVMYKCDAGVCLPGVFYSERLPSGVWQAPIKLDEWQVQSNFAITVTPDGLLRLAWVKVINVLDPQDAKLITKIRKRDGSWEANRSAEGKIAVGVGSPQFDASGKLHLVWNRLRPRDGSGVTLITDELADGSWSTPFALAQAEYAAPSLLFDAFGGQHFITNGFYFASSQSIGAYRRRSADSHWSTTTLTRAPGAKLGMLKMALDPRHIAHLISQDSQYGFSYHTSRLADQATTWHYSKTLSVPAPMHRPTLSFLYQLEGMNKQSQSLFAITISETVTTSLAAHATQVFSATGFTPQQIGWVDMTPWAGKTVTVTFAVHQAIGEPYLRAVLDEITLGSWNTPVAHTVTPAQLDVGVATTLVLKGENFDAAPTVRVGETQLNVQRRDENTLEAELPATLAPGIYALWITNADGQTFFQPNAVWIGKQLYLPLISH